MRFFKTVVGVLAILWIAVHVLEPLVRGFPSGDLATSWWMGKLVAVLVGVIVAVVCLRPSGAEKRGGDAER